MLKRGKLLRAYLPITETGLTSLICYYPEPPDFLPKPKPRLLTVDQVQWMQVREHYAEALPPPSPRERSQTLVTRRVAGPVEVLVVKEPPVLITSFLSSTPILSAPTAGTGASLNLRWYLRRGAGAPQLIDPARFTTQVAAFLADDAELARRVSQGGYGPSTLEELVRLYNQRTTSR